MVVPQAIIDEMIAHAKNGFPDEVCGLVGTADGHAMRLYQIESADPSPVTYRMDPKHQLQAINDIDDRGWEMGAIYHSHTHTRAYPSQTDVRLAFYPEALYIIVSLAEFEAPDVRAFRIQDDEIHEVALHIA